MNYEEVRLDGPETRHTTPALPSMRRCARRTCNNFRVNIYEVYTCGRGEFTSFLVVLAQGNQHENWGKPYAQPDSQFHGLVRTRQAPSSTNLFATISSSTKSWFGRAVHQASLWQFPPYRAMVLQSSHGPNICIYMLSAECIRL